MLLSSSFTLDTTVFFTLVNEIDLSGGGGAFTRLTYFCFDVEWCSACWNVFDFDCTLKCKR